VNQITELPEAKAQVIEVRQYGTTYSECGQFQVETGLQGLEMERTFGARLAATFCAAGRQLYKCNQLL